MEEQDGLTFSWIFQYPDDEQQFRAAMAEVLETWPGVQIACQYRESGAPYAADVEYRGREWHTVAYGLESLVGNIKSCLPA